MLIDFCILFLTVKKELDDQPYKYCDRLLSSISQKYSELVISQLGKSLRSDVCLLVNHNTSSIFRFKQFKKGLISIRAKSWRLEFTNDIDKLSHLFYIDKESLIYFSEYYFEGITVTYYDQSLISGNYNFLLIEAYQVIKNINIFLDYYEFSIRNSNIESKVEHFDIGVIHNTHNKSEEIETHFKNFFSDINLIGKLMYKVVEEYIESLLSLLNSKNILKTKIGLNHMNLFPFKFVKDLTVPFKGELLITGGICFDRLSRKQRNFFDLHRFFKYQKRFIFTYNCKIKKDDISLEPTY